jgi:Ran GTPase-activating protein (RanGAP) involved in mRNA processing and transport
MSDNMVAVAAAAVAALPALELLDLSGSSFGCDGTFALAAALARLTRLTALDLSGNLLSTRNRARHREEASGAFALAITLLGVLLLTPVPGALP